MPDLDEGKFYTADDMRKARAEGRGGNAPDQTDMVPSDAQQMWADPRIRRELLIVAAKAAQVAVRGRDDFAGAIGADPEATRQLLLPEDKAERLIQAAVDAAVIRAFAGLDLDISTDTTRVKLAMQLKRTFDLEENSSKLLKRIAWQALVGFIGFCFAAVAAWFGFQVHSGPHG